jgi:chromosome segregation ATPase
VTDLDESHVTSLEALRQFAAAFSAHVEMIKVTGADMESAAAEARSWIRSCRDQSRADLTEARERVEECKRELDDCLAEEDEDYVPDCSCEQSALNEAEAWLEECVRRHEKVKELDHRIHECTREFFRRYNEKTRAINERHRNGRRYVEAQIRHTEAALRLRGRTSP